MKSITFNLTDKEYKKLVAVKLKDYRNRCHHSWPEFLLRMTTFYEKEKLGLEEK